MFSIKRIFLPFLALAFVFAATGCTPHQVAVWRQWSHNDPEAATAFLQTDTFTELSTSADVTAQAERLDPPAPPDTTDDAPSFSNNCDEMSFYRQQAGLPSRFDSLGWRESNCRNEEGVHTGCCWGYWQLSVAVHLRDGRIAPRYHACGVYSRFDVDGDNPGDKRRQACAAKALFDVVGYSAWSL